MDATCAVCGPLPDFDQSEIEYHLSSPTHRRSLVGRRIRATHPYGFRSGEWATIVGVGQDGPRELYGVRFDDGVTDFWPVTDPSDPYEFKDEA